MSKPVVSASHISRKRLAQARRTNKTGKLAQLRQHLTASKRSTQATKQLQRKPKTFQEQLLTLSGMVLASLLLCGLGVYGVSLTLDHDIAQKTQKARWVDEQNQALEVELGRLQSFQKVETAAIGIPKLHVSTDTAVEILVNGFSGKPLPRHLQVNEPEPLPVYHY